MPVYDSNHTLFVQKSAQKDHPTAVKKSLDNLLSILMNILTNLLPDVTQMDSIVDLTQLYDTMMI